MFQKNTNKYDHFGSIQNGKQRNNTIIYVYKRETGRKQHPALQCFCGSGTAGSCICNYLVVDRVHYQGNGQTGKGKISIPQGSPRLLVVTGCVVASPHSCFIAKSTSTVAMYCTCGRFLTSVLNLGQSLKI